MHRFSRPFTRFSVIFGTLLGSRVKSSHSWAHILESPQLRKSINRFDTCSGLEISNGSALLVTLRYPKYFAKLWGLWPCWWLSRQTAEGHQQIRNIYEPSIYSKYLGALLPVAIGRSGLPSCVKAMSMSRTLYCQRMKYIHYVTQNVLNARS